MDQVRIGYTYWQQPEKSVMPEVFYVADTAKNSIPLFMEREGYISMEAENFARKGESERTHWEVIPGLGKTLSGVTTFPQNSYPGRG